MSVRKINYTVNENGVSPEVSQWGGIQYENNATSVSYVLEPKLKEKLLSNYPQAQKIVYRIDFDSPVAGYLPSENIEPAGQEIIRQIPLAITESGEPFQSTLVVTVLDDNTNEIGTLSSKPSRIYFSSVTREQYSEQDLSENISAMQESVSKMYSQVVEKADAVATNAVIANEAMQKTVNAKLSLESGAEIVFLGGNAESRFEVELAVDGAMSETSQNAIQNKAVTNELKNYALKNDVNISIEEAMQSVIERAVSSAVEAATEAAVSQAMVSARLAAHPVGSYYFSADSTDPSEIFGGVWSQIKDRFILAAGDNYAAGDMGGESAVSLTQAQLPKTYGLVADMVLQAATGIGVGGVFSRGYSAGTTSKVVNTTCSTMYTHEEGLDMYSDRAEMNFGNDEPHNNMPPYIVAYCWQRTA